MKNTVDTALVATGTTATFWMNILHQSLSVTLAILSIIVMVIRILSLWKSYKMDNQPLRDSRGRFIKRGK